MNVLNSFQAAFLFVVTSVWVGEVPTACAQSTAFSYQGRLNSSGAPYTGLSEMQFSLRSAAGGGNRVGNTLTLSPVAVTNGLFTVSLDFGNQFPGADRWLAIGVRTNGAGMFSALNPRVTINATPYAVHAFNATIAETATSVAVGAITASALAADVVDGSKILNGSIASVDLNANLLNNTFWNLAGNGGTTPETQFLGTADYRPLQFRVNDQHGLRLEYPIIGTVPNLVGGYSGNGVGASTEGAVIAGGWNIAASGIWESIGGGGRNIASGRGATIGGGSVNKATGNSSAIGGGSDNVSGGGASTVAGGEEITSSGEYATAGGGELNQSSGRYATIPGGSANTSSGDFSFAAGRRAMALHRGAFVWADGSEASAGLGERFFSTTANEFAVRATGGVRFVTAIDANGSNAAGITLAPGSGTWTSLSDRHAKENFTPANPREILNKVAALPLASWNYKAQGASVRHVGPLAQDFPAAFGLGTDDKHIATVDAVGVALAAIQGLNGKVEERSERAEIRIQWMEEEIKC